MSQPPMGPYGPGPMGPMGPYPPPMPVAPPPYARPLPPHPGYPPPGWQDPGIPYRGPQPPPPPPRPMGPTVPPWAMPHPGAFQPRRSNTGAIVASVLVALLVVGAGTVGFLALTKKKHHVADSRYDYPATSSYQPTSTGRTTTTRRTTTTTTTTSRATPTTTTTTRSTTTSTKPAGPQPVYKLGDNPLFAGNVGAAAITCTLNRWRSDQPSAASFFASAIPCLEAAWVPVLRNAGLPYSSPGLEVPADGTIDTPCTGSEGRSFSAFYCPRNHTIYMPLGSLQIDQYGAHPGVYLAVLAHEFGHHVQSVTGVLDAYWDARYDAGADTEAGLDLARRSELQAQCFSGMFLAATYPRGSVDGNILQEARSTQNRGDHNPGEPRDHGSDAHSSAWWEQGAQKNRTFQCNTWLANAADVA